MIVSQSTATGMAERPIGNPKSAAGMSSPGGEGWGLSRRSVAKADEGELYTDWPAIVPQGRLNFCPLSPFPSLHWDCAMKSNQRYSKPFKANQGLFEKKLRAVPASGCAM